MQADGTCRAGGRLRQALPLVGVGFWQDVLTSLRAPAV